MNLEERIAQAYDNLNNTDRRILSLIVQDPAYFASCSAAEAAGYCSVSRATLLRAIRKADIPSFAALKYLCGTQHQEIRETGSTIRDIYKEYESVLYQLLLKPSFEKQAKLILESRKIYLYGTGNEQKAIAGYLKSRLLECGILAQELFDEGEIDFCLSSLKKEDLFIVISLSGTSPALIRLVHKLHVPGTMSLTRLKDNPLSLCCDHQLYVSTASVLEGEYELVGAFYTVIDLLIGKCRDLQQIADPGEPGSGSSLRRQILKHYSRLSETDRYIAQAFLQKPENLIDLSISRCARQLHVSPSALTRFAMKLGCEGYAQFRALIHVEEKESSPVQNNIDWYRSYQVLFSLLQEISFAPLLERVNRASRLFFVSAYSRYISVVSEMMRMFLPLHKSAYFYAGEEAVAYLPDLLEDEDVVFVFAPQGNDNRIDDFLKSISFSNCFVCMISALLPFLSSEPLDLLVQVPGIGEKHDMQLGPFYVLAELLYVQCRANE
ncbi:SIS domain-containing protein [Erysipelotrichaceae bacterium 66-17]